MKKTLIGLLLLTIASAVFAQTAPARNSAVIRELSGNVELRAAGSANFTPARVGDIVAEDTIVSTAFRSSAVIQAGSAVLTVQPLTRLSLTEIRAAAGTEALNVNLQAGRVRVDVNPPAGTRASMSVSSPSATASVRGTSFEFDTNSLRVLSGQVNFGGTRGSPVMVNAGFTNSTGVNGQVVNPLTTQGADLLPDLPEGACPESGLAGSMINSQFASFPIVIRTHP